MDLEQHFKFNKNLSWLEVFALWKGNEAEHQYWIKLYQERGYTNWEEWRMTYAAPLLMDKLEWKLYEIKDPISTVPDFYGGPFTAWQEQYKGKESVQYKDLINEDTLNRVDGKINELSKNFPKQTFFVGLIHNGEIVIIEGTHRCLALALMAKNKQNSSSTVNIALAKSQLDKLPIVGGTVL